MTDPRKILVVEDSEFMNSLVASTLQDAGFETVSAFNGQQGVELAQAEKPDLIVMDIMMPIMDGFEATWQIKSDPGTSAIPVLVLTALDKIQDMVRALDAGADNFLNKPFDGPVLVERIRSILDNYEKVKSGDTAKMVALRDIDKNIALTDNRRQIFQALLAALKRVADCQVFSVLIVRKSGRNLFIVTTEHQIPHLVLENFREKVFGISARLLRDDPFHEDCQIEMIHSEEKEKTPAFSPPYRSAIHVPFYEEFEAGGILSIGTAARDAYNEEDFKFLFQLGEQIAPTLSKIALEA